MGAKLDYVVEELYKMSQRGMADFLNPGKDGSYEVDFVKAQEAGALNNIRKLTADRTGKITIELYDQLEILGTLAKLGDAGNNEEQRNYVLESIVKTYLEAKKNSNLINEVELDDE